MLRRFEPVKEHLKEQMILGLEEQDYEDVIPGFEYPIGCQRAM